MEAGTEDKTASILNYLSNYILTKKWSKKMDLNSLIAIGIIIVIGVVILNRFRKSEAETGQVRPAAGPERCHTIQNSVLRKSNE